ncbi:MAG: family 16 glycoside hydrolase [Desulfomonilaceae bacterium]
MGSHSGMAIIVVIALLLVVSLIAVGLMSQTVTNTKFFEAMATSYVGIGEAQKDVVKHAPITGLAIATGKRPSDGTLASVLYAAPQPLVGTSTGTLTGNVWRPGLCGTFYRNYNGSGTITSDGAVLNDSYLNPAKKGVAESAFLFNDNAGPNGQNVLPSWNNYAYHVEFNADAAAALGVYFNAGPTSGEQRTDQAITGYLFRISPKDQTFSIAEVHNGTSNPGISLQSKGFQDASLQQAFDSWTNSTQAGTGGLYDQWHSIDVHVQTQGEKTPVTITVNVDGVQVFNYTDTKGSLFPPYFAGLSNWSGDGWGAPASVNFRNISVTNTSF